MHSVLSRLVRAFAFCETRQPFVQCELEEGQPSVKRLLRDGAVEPDGLEVRVVCVWREQHA